MTTDHAAAPRRAPHSLAPHTAAAKPPDHSPSVPDADETGNTPVCLDSAQLLQGNSSVEIAHRGTVYRLQATRQGKLILTK